jgi:hypothetical protein
VTSSLPRKRILTISLVLVSLRLASAQNPSPIATATPLPVPPPIPPGLMPVPPANAPAPIVAPPPAKPLPTLPPPPLRPALQPLARPDLAETLRLTPRIEVWRPNAAQPQVPARHRQVTDHAFVTDTDPMTLRLQFNPTAAGERVVVTAANGFSLNPPEQVLTVSSRGDCQISGQLVEGASRGHILIRCKMIRTVVPVTRASLATVQAEEARTGGRP